MCIYNYTFTVANRTIMINTCICIHNNLQLLWQSNKHILIIYKAMAILFTCSITCTCTSNLKAFWQPLILAPFINFDAFRPHTLYLIPHTPYLIPHIPHLILYTSYPIPHTSYRHFCLVLQHQNRVFSNWPCITWLCMLFLGLVIWLGSAIGYEVWYGLGHTVRGKSQV